MSRTHAGACGAAWLAERTGPPVGRRGSQGTRQAGEGCMKRIFATFVLLAGLSGCISFTATPQGEKKPADAKSVLPNQSLGGVGMAPPSLAMPTNPTWTANPEH